MVTNSTIETLLNRRSIRKFVAEPFDDDTVATLETVAQHAASSQYLNDWSAVRVKDPALKKRMSEIGRQPYIAEAPLLYVFVADEHRNAIIAESKGVPTDSDTYGLAGSYRFSGPERCGSGFACDGDRRLFARPGMRHPRFPAQ